MPQIIGKFLRDDDSAWQIYLLLRNVTDMVFFPTVKKYSLTYLNGLITEFLSQYVALFGADMLTPKHHYMIHYARLIRMFGLLRPLWCMRFEGKHQYFKSVVASLGNYINVTATMANRHQMRQCWELINSDALCEEPRTLTSTTVWQFAQLPADLRSTIQSKLDTQCDPAETVTVTKRVLCSHVQYAVNACLVLDVAEVEEIPVYFKVKYIVNFRDTRLLCGRLCFCLKFNQHLHAYSVCVDVGWAVVYPGQEADHSMHNFFCAYDECNFVNSGYHVCAVDDR